MSATTSVDNAATAAPIYIANIAATRDHTYRALAADGHEQQPVPTYDSVWDNYNYIPLVPPPGLVPNSGGTSGVDLVKMALVAVPGSILKLQQGPSGIQPTPWPPTTTILNPPPAGTNGAQQLLRVIPATFGTNDVIGNYAPTLVDRAGVNYPYDGHTWIVDGINHYVEFPYGVPTTMSLPAILTIYRYIGPTGGSGGGVGTTPIWAYVSDVNVGGQTNLVPNMSYPGVVTSTFIVPVDAQTTEGAGVRFMFDPVTASVRGGSTSGTAWDVVNRGAGSVAFGVDTIAAGALTNVMGGQLNTIDITSLLSYIGGGVENSIVNGEVCVIGGGSLNSIAIKRSSTVLYQSTICGGGVPKDAIMNSRGNLVENSGVFIGGGGYATPYTSSDTGHTASGLFSTIVGGGNGYTGGGGTPIMAGHSATGDFSTIVGGGVILPTTPDSSTITRAYGHIASGAFSFIGGGGNNNFNNSNTSTNIVGHQVAGDYSSIVGGANHIIDVTSGYSFIGGGLTNSIGHHIFAVIVGGANNTITAPSLSDNNASFIGAGVNNTISSAQRAFIGGGSGHTINTGIYGAIVGGTINNIFSGSSNIIGAGSGNVIGLSDGTYATQFASILGGESNSITGACSDATICGGSSNTIQSASIPPFPNFIVSDHAVIVGGIQNVINGGIDSFIGGGNTNLIDIDGGGTIVSVNCAIVCGANHTVLGCIQSAIICGNSNAINTSTQSLIGAGNNNTIVNSSYSSIVGGINHTISNVGGLNFIGGGDSNTIGAKPEDDQYAVIVGGYTNTIQGGSVSSIIGGGRSNSIYEVGGYCTIGGGTFNVIGSNGVSPIVDMDQSSTIVGGNNNLIVNSQQSFIGGGISNQINPSTTPYPSGGNNNVIGGGNNNQITSSLATIPGGQNNIAAGDGSFVCGAPPGGGTSNTDGGMANSFVWGDISGIDPSAVTNAGPNGVWFGCGTGGTPSTTPAFTIFTSAGRLAGNAGTSLMSSGTAWVTPSERSIKENLIELAHEDILDRVAALPVYEFNYRGASTGLKCRGPCADNWHELFPSEKTKAGIDTQDMSGITLSAVKGLIAAVDRMSDRIEILEHREAYSQSRIVALEAALSIKPADPPPMPVGRPRTKRVLSAPITAATALLLIENSVTKTKLSTGDTK